MAVNEDLYNEAIRGRRGGGVTQFVHGRSRMSMTLASLLCPDGARRVLTKQAGGGGTRKDDVAWGVLISCMISSRMTIGPRILRLPGREEVIRANRRGKHGTV